MNIDRPAGVVVALARDRDVICLHGLGVKAGCPRLRLPRSYPAVVLRPRRDLHSYVAMTFRDAKITTGRVEDWREGRRSDPSHRSWRGWMREQEPGERCSLLCLLESLCGLQIQLFHALYVFFESIYTSCLLDIRSPGINAYRCFSVGLFQP